MVLGSSPFAIRNTAAKRAARRLQSTRLAHGPKLMTIDRFVFPVYGFLFFNSCSEEFIRIYFYIKL